MCPRLTPISGVPAGRASSAARSSVPSPPRTMTSSAPVGRLRPGRQHAGARAVQGGGLLLGHPYRYADRGQPVDNQSRAAQRVLPAGVRDHQHRPRRFTHREQLTVPHRPLGDERPVRPRLLRAIADSIASRRAASSRRRGAADLGEPDEVLPRVARTGPGAGSRSRRARRARATRPPPQTDRTASARSSRRADHAACGADPALAHLELRLDHQHEVRVRRRAGHQRRQHQGKRDERWQVGHHDLRRRRDLVQPRAPGRSPGRAPSPDRRSAATRRAGRSPRPPRPRAPRPPAAARR